MPIAFRMAACGRRGRRRPPAEHCPAGQPSRSGRLQRQHRGPYPPRIAATTRRRGINKRDLIEHTASEAGIASAAAEADVGAALAAIAEALARGEEVAVAGFGLFARKEQTAREGRNPRTGKPIAIGPSSGVSFKAARVLKDSLN